MMTRIINQKDRVSGKSERLKKKKQRFTAENAEKRFRRVHREKIFSVLSVSSLFSLC